MCVRRIKNLSLGAQEIPEYLSWLLQLFHVIVFIQHKCMLAGSIQQLQFIKDQEPTRENVTNISLVLVKHSKGTRKIIQEDIYKLVFYYLHYFQINKIIIMKFHGKFIQQTDTVVGSRKRETYLQYINRPSEQITRMKIQDVGTS